MSSNAVGSSRFNDVGEYECQIRIVTQFSMWFLEVSVDRIKKKNTRPKERGYAAEEIFVVDQSLSQLQPVAKPDDTIVV